MQIGTLFSIIEDIQNQNATLLLKVKGKTDTCKSVTIKLNKKGDELYVELCDEELPNPVKDK